MDQPTLCTTPDALMQALAPAFEGLPPDQAQALIQAIAPALSVNPSAGTRGVERAAFGGGPWAVRAEDRDLAKLVRTIVGAGVKLGAAAARGSTGDATAAGIAGDAIRDLFGSLFVARKKGVALTAEQGWVLSALKGVAAPGWTVAEVHAALPEAASLTAAQVTAVLGGLAKTRFPSGEALVEQQGERWAAPTVWGG